MTVSRADKFVDGRNLEPPEPFVQTMEALDQLAPGETLLLLVRREPFPLYRALELNGYSWQTAHAASGDVEVSIRRKA